MSEQLLDAIRAGDDARVTALLEANPDLIGARAANGVSAISLSMYHGKPEIANLFVQRGAQLDAFEAAALGALDRLRQLLAADPALLHQYSVDGFPLLGLASFFGHQDTVRYLIEQGADVNAQARNDMLVRPIHAAVARRDAAIVRLLLEHGADPNAQQQGGFTPLRVALGHNDTEIVDLLLSHGATRDQPE